MKQVVLFGAGKSAGYLISYLLDHAESDHLFLTIVDSNLSAAEEKLRGSKHGNTVMVDIHDSSALNELITAADLIISLLPPTLHIKIAHACLKAKKNLLTASYVDAEMKSLSTQAEQQQIIFLCEMGLDPGIDHMSALKMLDEIRSSGGMVTSFISHCGGLVAPESDNNPWHYKISWNPANIVHAGTDGAIFKQDGAIKELEYGDLFAEKRYVSIPHHDVLCWYPNRDSLRYINAYELENCNTFIRTTLRHPDFMYGWKNVIDLKLTSTSELYDTDGKTLADWFKEHMDKNNFSDWLQDRLQEQLASTKNLLTELVNLVKLEEEAEEQGVKKVEEFMVVNEEGDLQKVDIDNLKISAAAALADRMHDANLTLKQLFFLGMEDDVTVINKGTCSAADILQLALEKKLKMEADDRDMVVMLHEVEFVRDGENFKRTASMIVKGDADHTAMAKTVGLPLAIAATHLLKTGFSLKGVQIPTSPEIYSVVLPQLEKRGIVFSETEIKLKK